LDFLTALLVDRHKRGRLRHQGGKYYEQTEIDGIEVMYVVDWLLK